MRVVNDHARDLFSLHWGRQNGQRHRATKRWMVRDADSALRIPQTHYPTQASNARRIGSGSQKVSWCSVVVAPQFFIFQRQLQRRGRHPRRGARRHAPAGLVSSPGAALNIARFTATSDCDSYEGFLGTFCCVFDRKSRRGSNSSQNEGFSGNLPGKPLRPVLQYDALDLAVSMPDHERSIEL